MVKKRGIFFVLRFFFYYFCIVKCLNQKGILKNMTKEEIYKTIENGKWRTDKSPFGKCESSETLLFIGKDNAYSVHGVNYGEGIKLCFTKIFPKLKMYSSFDEYPYPKEIETMESIWSSEMREKYGDIYTAMKSIGNI